MPEELAVQELASATALPARFYHGKCSHALDRRAVFARSWQLMGPASRLDAPGDHVVGEIAGVPVIVVRGEDNRLRGFHNVCRHRAGPLATCDGTGVSRLRCRYHGWTYGLDGRLRSAPDMDGAADFDPALIRLPEIRLAAWQGLLFAALDDSPPPLDELLGGIDERLPDGAFAGHVFHRRISYDIACNWKVYVDNYLEGYHVPHVHPGLNRLLDYRSYATETGRWHSLQHSPLESAGELYGDGEALYCFVWPNTLLNILPERLQTNRVMPTGTAQCRVDFDYYYAGEVDAVARHATDQAFSDEVQAEDVTICEQVQRGLSSGSYVPGRLNPRHESGVHHFHELLRAAYRADPGEEQVEE
jgi:choline monooxygenase